MKTIKKQEKEDFLSLMYEMKRKENLIIKSDLAREMNISLSKVTKVTDELLEKGYLIKDENRHLYLTDIGLSLGREYLERKRCLTEFLRLVSGVDGSIARENACAIEHMLDERVLLGIRMFMENRHTYSYITRGNDLNVIFQEGVREMPVAFYKRKGTLPRELAEEYYLFQKRARVNICEESYLYLQLEREPLVEKDEQQEDTQQKDIHPENTLQLEYEYQDRWRQAEKTEHGYAILTEALDCTIRRNDRLSEGIVKVRRPGHEPCLLDVSLI